MQYLKDVLSIPLLKEFLAMLFGWLGYWVKSNLLDAKYPRQVPSYSIEFDTSMELAKSVMQSDGDVKSNPAYPVFRSARRNVRAHEMLYECGISVKLNLVRGILLSISAVVSLAYMAFHSIKVAEVTIGNLLDIKDAEPLMSLSVYVPASITFFILAFWILNFKLALRIVYERLFPVARDIISAHNLELSDEPFGEMMIAQCREEITAKLEDDYGKGSRMQKRRIVSALNAYGFGSKKDIRKRLQESDAANDSHSAATNTGGTNTDHVPSCDEKTGKKEDSAATNSPSDGR